ncbi:CRISPR-associated helicase Cas3 [Caldicellulosiruptor saccharolyticus DSM 8903]|uniref:CRISPR-associated helicase Cas3 n=1 Tax=Caldicellulosiruptor saccharolyticus (strain ATCC 43494 / DSM 8903 / Tp8T 6331) TaxID=351627 RepID=A4XGC8_CALS8|nr:CRISPR-associated helicase/endonuclease Cas3 [Caldicellulosiruptor saccharolyticus]ABP65963.1 CRISPR-associated helicase Cas3 [Caldicellulosiruptor saccharolyticus DSM 8903]
MSEIWAKSVNEKNNNKRVTLSNHVSDVLKVFEFFKKKFSDNQFILNAAEIAIFFHDLGKVLPSFQIKALGNIGYYPRDVVYEIPHSLFSVFWINIDKLKEKLNSEEYLNYIISAIAYHHWKDNFDEIISLENKQLKQVCEKVIYEWKDELKENLDKEFGKISSYDEYKELIDVNITWLKAILSHRLFVNLAVPPYKFDYHPLRGEVKKEWIFISGVLQRCDHFASWCEEEGIEEELGNVEIDAPEKENVTKIISRSIGDKAWQFKELEKCSEKNTILIAPTGYGKTEFAFLWSSGEKLFYTLPLRASVNNTFERAKNAFGCNKTGLLHSDADVYLLDKSSDETGSIKLCELAKQLSYPVIVSTGDQFFPYALRPPGFERIFVSLSYSRIAIDEIQAYSPKACAIIVKFLEWVYKMGGKFLLMTATMPKFVIDYLKDVIPDFCKKVNFVNIYEKEKDAFSKLYKHKIRLNLIETKDKQFDIPDEIIREVLQKAKDNKRVLVILNTVGFAQSVYDKLKNSADEQLKERIFLIHSRYTLKDRENKEFDYINNKFKNPKTEDVGKILVATQVVEASLDIDADILYTEMCPLDCLVQRMGRVLRRYFYKDGEVINKGNNNKFNLDKPFKAFEKEHSEVNVNVFIFNNNNLQSGGHRVYSRELIILSLAWLWKLKNTQNSLEELFNKITKQKFNNNEIEKLFTDEFTDLISNRQSSGKKSKKSKDENKESVYKYLLSNSDWLKTLDKMEIELSEYDKYILVTLFYSSLKEDGDYLKDFYNTLYILNSGLMSERKVEAERIFRDISDVQIITKNKFEDFKKDTEEFIKSVEHDDKNKRLLFTQFKKSVLSKYVVMYFYSANFELAYKKLIAEVEMDNKWKQRFKRWLSGIYLSDKHDYNYDKGLIKINDEDKEGR